MKNINISLLAKPNIRSLRAYHAEEVPCKVKLDANESPYSGARVKKILQTLNRYPDPEAKQLRKIIAEGSRVKPENILHGNGSDELIYYLITTFGGPVLYPVPTFSMYGIIAQALGEKKIEVPLDNKFDLDIEKILAAIKRYKPKLIFLSSPNNPTGNCFSSDRILKIVEFTYSLPPTPYSLVVIDEAYQPFSKTKSFVPLLGKYGNLLVLRTLSKIGLAGLRLGFLIAGESVISEVNKVRLPFNVNSLSQAVAVEALKDKKQMRRHISSIISERKRLLAEMRKIEGITPYPSDANFVLFKVNNAEKVYNGLLRKGVLIRNMTGAVKDCLRVTAGTPGENTVFLKALREVINSEN
ncbi:MAG: histidinol-phosphate transaminase [Nitrospiraceae bacterium]|nr:MAG: histidinol-phosphate transaminase [Nitrospiraceae bacterium]